MSIDELKRLSDEQLEDIVIRGANLNIPDSQASIARRILDYRRQGTRISIGTNNGQVVGTNNGAMTQNNNKELVDALQALAAILIKDNPTDQITSEALGNIRDIQTEVFKSEADKTKMQKAAEGLQALANLTQFTSFIIQVTPLLHTIKQCVTNFKLP